MRENENFSLLGQDIKGLSKGAVLGGPIYKEMKEKSRRPASKEEKKEGFYHLLVRRAPLLIPSLGGLFLVGCTREVPAVCPPIPEDCLMVNEQRHIIRGEDLKGHQSGWKSCHHGPWTEDPNFYLVDIWRVDNEEELANCLLVCNRPLEEEEIDEICDEEEKFPEILPEIPTPTPDSLPNEMLEVSYKGNK